MSERTEDVLDLQKVADRFARWRSQKAPGERIPQHLREQAALVVGPNGLGATAKALRVGYYDLQKWVAQGRPSAGIVAQSAAASTFVEIAMPDRVPNASRAAVTLEMRDACGKQMRIQASDCSVLELAGVVQAFWRQPS